MNSYLRIGITGKQNGFSLASNGLMCSPLWATLPCARHFLNITVSVFRLNTHPLASETSHFFSRILCPFLSTSTNQIQIKMKFAFFTCLLIILALMAATETVISQKPLNARNMKKIAGESPSRCAHPLLPGLMAMSRGIDLTTLDLFPANIRADFGFKKTLFEFNCSFNQTWQHPTVQTARLYSQPNYVTVNTMSAGKLSTDERFISSLFDFKLAMGTSVGIKVPLEIGSFSASAGLKIALDFLLRENRSVIEVSIKLIAILGHFTIFIFFFLLGVCHHFCLPDGL